MSIYSNRVFLIYFCCVAAILGAVFGSFLNCAAYRIARGQSFLKGRSHCPDCGHVLGLPDLIPVFSWLLLRGRCRHCGAKISPRYMFTELIFALVTVVCLLRYDLTVLFLRNWIFFCCLFCLSLTDLDDQIIPDGCLIISVIAWGAALPLLRPGWPVIRNGLIAAVVFGGGILLLSLAMDRILKRDSLGGGDIKLFAVAGLYLGLVGSLLSVMLACILGLLFALLRRGRGGKKGAEFPFGPAISLATALVMLWGDGVVQWYVSLFKI